MKSKQNLIRNVLLSGLAIFFLIFSPTFAETLPNSTSTNDTDILAVQTRELVPEPNIRVGLYKTNEVVQFRSDFVYDIWIDDKIAGLLLVQDTAVLSYSKGVYTFKSESLIATSSKYIRLVPQDAQSFFTILNYNRPVKGRGKINFNTYRGALEYRYSPKSKLPYIINELPLDSYVLGVAETHNSAPEEYIKALMVAARSYAHAMIAKTPATDKRMFDVYPTTADQIYLGYNSELFMPRVAKAAFETNGELVVYNGNPVVTPYFSHSNGATLNWKGKDRPWLKSVKAVYDKGKKMLGHGIGMSNYDAEKHAAKDGWTYDQILKFYYTSTTVEKIY